MTDEIPGIPDYLAPLSEQRVAAWYRRLAQRVGQERIDGEPPLAPFFLNHYLDNRNPDDVLSYEAPNYLRSFLRPTLQYHRGVFLTEQRARTHGGRVWAGVLPRIQGLRGFTPWDLSGTTNMEYESLVEVGSNEIEIWWLTHHGTPVQKDLLTAFHGFQLHSRVTVSGQRLTNSHVRITFDAWGCRVLDWYHFNYHKYFSVPNPDYRASPSQLDAVRRQDRDILVYHRNARRIERAGLAAPYHSVSSEWQVRDVGIAGSGEVDPSRRL